MTCDEFCDDRAWDLEQLEADKQLVRQYKAALAAIATGAQSYQIDTGQSRQLVSRANVGSVRLALQSLESSIATRLARLGCAKTYVRPGW